MSGGRRFFSGWSACSFVRLSVLLVLAGPAWAQELGSDPAPAARAPVEAAAPAPSDVIRARILARLGRIEDAWAELRALLARAPLDRNLREDYAEALVDWGLVDQGLHEVDALLRKDPGSLRLRRLRARVDLLRGEHGLAAERFESLAQEVPDDPVVLTDLAAADLGSGRWSRALSLYGEFLQHDPDHEGARGAYRDILLGHASRFTLTHTTLLQAAATHHADELGWKGWLGDRSWLRAGVRSGFYVQDTTPFVQGFTADIQTAFVLLGLRLDPRWMARVGLDEARRADTLRTTLRLGTAFDDGRATSASLDLGVRELLTNPVVAIPLRGTTDRLTTDVSHRLLARLTVGAHYERRHYRVSGEELGAAWDASGRAEIELLRSRIQLTLVPQLFFSQFNPSAGSPLRDRVTFLRRQDILALGILVGAELWPGLRAQIGSVGRHDVHRALTSSEVTGEARWQIGARIELHVLYTRNTEGGTVGGKEETFTGGLAILH